MYRFIHKTDKLNDHIINNSPFYVETGMKPHFNLGPIPEDEIEGNRGAIWIVKVVAYS
ncbi:hypothetical protein Q2T41_14445 [Maribacter confluentis]|uniref:Uncharacterized protein n=1 Tax=Maribacter confluentis TaxID=1656093 RepID=A0ABT8RTY0_9FLAO|nr:hypothetical protein [Maribacter confluentis]MDO1513857.1 hypothetical protein [Maribacter confluentis]